MQDAYKQEEGNADLWRTIFQEGHPALKKQHWIHMKLPSEPRCRLCFTPFKGLGGWYQKTFKHKSPSNRNPHYCNACDGFLEANPGGAEVDMSILYIDIRESTQFAAVATPMMVNQRINDFLNIATKTITDNDGFIMAFYGDCIVAVWPPGFTGPDHSTKAVSAAKALVETFEKKSETDHPIPVGIGCHTGNIYIGTVQANKGTFRDVSVFGQDVILAARLAGKAQANEALISDECWKRSAVGNLPENLRQMSLKGLEEAVTAHSLKQKDLT